MSTTTKYVVVGNAGRLQLPAEYLESLGLSGRAEVELTEHGILVKPAKALDDAPAQVARGAREAEDAQDAEGGGRAKAAAHGLRGLFSRGKRGNKEE